MRVFSVAPRLCAATRASFSAPSIASVPLLVKNTRSMPDHSASFRASGPWYGW